MNPLRHRLLLTAVAAISGAGLLTAQPLPSGRWDGAIRLLNQELGIRVHFAPQGDSLAATIDIPPQNAFGLPLTNVRCVPPSLSFDLPAGPGLAMFRGQMAGDSISGRFEQSGLAGTFFLRPAREDTAKPATAAIPVPYTVREVRFQSDTITLAGTLTIPSTGGPFPALVMITGSGPQNRDGEVFGFKMFGLIADSLTRAGIAVLRYDDRGVGGSGGRLSDATTSDFAADAEAGLDFLRRQAGIRPDAVGILGHSEGGIAGAIVAARRRDVNFLVLLAAPAVSGDSLIDFQIVSIARRGGASEQEIRRILSLQHRTYEAARRGTGFDTLELLLTEEATKSLEKLPEEDRRAIASSDSLIQSHVAVQMASIRSPWFKEFISFNPADVLDRVTCPVLALFGEVDQQVPPSLNRAPMERGLRRGGNKDVSIRTLPKANHLFLRSETGDTAEYGTMKKEFVERFPVDIISWLRKRTGH